MFECVETLLIQLINCMPVLLIFILVMNLICSMLFSK